jgi:hypothetical protein
MKHKEYFIDGTLVQSHYRGHWIGIILYSENNYSDKDTVYMVKPLWTQYGRPIRKAYPRKLSEHWLKKYYNTI